MTLRWETTVEWIDVKHLTRLRDSRWFCPWFQIKTLSYRCEYASLAEPADWLDGMFPHRLRESRPYCNRNRFETSSTQCDHASLGNTCALNRGHDSMQVFELRGDDALVAVSIGDRHGRSAPLWLLVIASVSFCPLEQFGNLSRGFFGGSHFGLVGWWYPSGFSGPVATSQ